MASSMFILPFGKHKGEPIEDLSDSYLEWLLDQDWMEEKFPEGLEAILKEVQYRERFSRPEQSEEDEQWNRRSKKIWQ
jgi:uncharacterized protein (DUF3820 family)